MTVAISVENPQTWVMRPELKKPDSKVTELLEMLQAAGSESGSEGAAQAATTETSVSELREHRAILGAEVERLRQFVRDYNADTKAQLNELEADMVRLEGENTRLRAISRSTYFERDACIGLLAHFAKTLGLPVGTCRTQVVVGASDGSESTQAEQRVVVDLPKGQVSWDFLEEDEHLFSGLPEYTKPVEAQSIQETYRKVMESGPELSPDRSAL